MFYAWTWVVGLFLGATIGSFLNVVIYRLPRGISLSNPPKSFCPKCHHSLGPADLVPLLSWLFLRGRCRYCKAPVPARYFGVELFNGVIWAFIWYHEMVLAWNPAAAIAYAAASSALVAIIFVDWELYLIPDQINAFLLLVGGLYNAWLYYAKDPKATTWGMPSAVAGALLGVGVLWGIALLGRVLFRKDAMGHGDIKMTRGIGAILFPGLTLISIGLAVVAGAVLGGLQVWLSLKSSGHPSGSNTDAEGSRTELGDPLEPSSSTEEDCQPESIGSLFKSLVGYLLCIDVIGLFVPKLYESWFGENPYTPVQEMEDFEVQRTMIPFGPYLAIGAIGAVVFQAWLLQQWSAYVEWVTGGR